MTRAKVPCTKDCPDRCIEPNCHMVCPMYLKYIEDRKAELALIRKHKETRYHLDCFETDVGKRNRSYSNAKYLQKRG